MADIAQIGFAANTSDLERAQGVLEALPPAVNNVERSSNSLAKTISTTGTAAQAASSGVNVLGKTLANVTNTADRMAVKFRTLQQNIDSANRIGNVAAGANDNMANRAADLDAYGKSLDALRAKYNPLFAAGQQYKVTLNDINRALAVGAINEKEHANAIKNTKAAFAQQVTNINKSSDAMKGMSYQAQNLSYQIIDVGQGILSGQPIFQIFAQQAGQIGQIIATTPGGLGGLMKELGTRISALLTPVRLITAGFLALAAAAIFAVTSTAKSSIALDDLSKSIDVSITKLHALQQAMSFKGISTQDSGEALQGFSQAVYMAQQNAGDLNGLMIANNKQAKTFMDYFYNVADLVAQTKSGVQKIAILQAASLPTTQAFVRFMSQGSEGIKAAAAATVEFNDAAEKNLIAKARQFDDAWNTATTKMAQYFKSSVISALEWVDQLSTKTTAIITVIAALIAGALAPFSLTLAALTGLVAAALGAKTALQAAAGERPPQRVIITGGTTEGKPKPGPDPKTQQQLLLENQQMQQRLSLLGDLATVEEQVRIKQLQLDAAGLQRLGVNKEQYKALLNLTRAQAEMNRVQQQATVGVFNLNDANKAAADTLQSWIDKKLLDPTNAQQMAAAQTVLAKTLRDTADAAAVAGSTLPQLKQLELDTNNVSKTIDTAAVGAVNSLSSALGDVFSRTTSVSQGFKNMGNIILQALQQVIIKLLIIGPLMKAFGGGGLLSFFGLSKGGVAGGTGLSTTTTGGLYAMGGVFANDNVQKFANGGAFTNKVVNRTTFFANGGKLAAMGEAGPEAIMPLKRGPGGSLGVQMYGGRGGGNNAPQIVYAPVNTYQVGGKVTQEDLDVLKNAQDNDRRNFGQNFIKTRDELDRRNYKTRRG